MHEDVAGREAPSHCRRRRFPSPPWQEQVAHQLPQQQRVVVHVNVLGREAPGHSRRRRQLPPQQQKVVVHPLLVLQQALAHGHGRQSGAGSGELGRHWQMQQADAELAAHACAREP
jgi:hypothetical protein